MLICPECSSIVQKTNPYCFSCGCPIDYIIKHQSTSSVSTNIHSNYLLKSLFDKYDSMILLDVETTGLDAKTNQIIELAAIKLRTQNNTLFIEKEMDNFIKLPHGMTLPSKIVELTNITDDMLSHQGQKEELVCHEFSRLLLDDKILIAAYNAQFDMSFIKIFLEKNNYKSIFEKIDMLDVLSVYKDRREYPHKLKDAINGYKLNDKVQNSHLAIDDVKATLEVLKEMDKEKNDLHKYINLFGYNPKYGVNGEKLNKIKYLPQPYNSHKKLYEQVK